MFSKSLADTNIIDRRNCRRGWIVCCALYQDVPSKTIRALLQVWIRAVSAIKRFTVVAKVLEGVVNGQPVVAVANAAANITFLGTAFPILCLAKALEQE